MHAAACAERWFPEAWPSRSDRGRDGNGRSHGWPDFDGGPDRTGSRRMRLRGSSNQASVASARSCRPASPAGPILAGCDSRCATRMVGSWIDRTAGWSRDQRRPDGAFGAGPG